ncbi:hypothetical protein ABFS82_05G066300 [Erythranthe guttata]
MKDDPNPPPSPAAPAAPPPSDLSELHSLDDTIEHFIGNFGLKQLIQSVLLSFAWFFDAQQTFISVFTDSKPEWICNDHFSSSTCNSTANICRLPKESWSWKTPAHASIVSDWSLECAGPIITALPSSSFFLGCLTGGFVLATLSDSFFGRKNMLVLSTLIMSVSGLLTAASTNIWTYVGLRFVSGFGRSSVGICALVHASELIGKKWRQKVGVFGFLFCSFGFLSLPLIAFLIRGSSWRFMYIWTCSPCVIYSFVLYFSANESPRWLFINGRRKEFAETLRSMSSKKNINLTERFFENCVRENIDDDRRIYSILLGKKWALRRLASSVMVGFGVGMAYYGMPLGLGSLSFGNLYLSVALNAASELSAEVLLFVVIGKLKRRGSLLGLCLLSGVCGSASVFAVGLKGVEMALELVSFFSVCNAFNVLLIYVVELFPTRVRSSAMSVVRGSTLVGGLVGPIVVGVAGGKNGGSLAYVVFGAAIAVCGFTVVLLPETKGKTLCDYMEEEEARDGEVISYGV